jgi:hypothetical protein
LQVRGYISGLLCPHMYTSALCPNSSVSFESITSTSTRYRSTLLERQLIHQAIFEPIVSVLVDFEVVIIIVIKVILKVILVLVLTV